MIAFEKLPPEFQTPAVRPYYDILRKKQLSLVVKRLFDILVSLVMLVFLLIPIAVIAVVVRLDSEGPVLFRQERVTTYGKRFKINKFRTMVVNAEALGTQVTTNADSSVTKTGRFLRKYRLDELPQVFNVLGGSMSFVGTRPEVPRYVEQYAPEYNATLLMPAGITSEASIRYKDEDKLLNEADDVDRVYMEKVLPNKMKWNLESIQSFDIYKDFRTLIRTVFAVLGKNYV